MASNQAVITQPPPGIVYSSQWSSGICDCTDDLKDCKLYHNIVYPHLIIITDYCK